MVESKNIFSILDKKEEAGMISRNYAISIPRGSAWVMAISLGLLAMIASWNGAKAEGTKSLDVNLLPGGAFNPHNIDLLFRITEDPTYSFMSNIFIDLGTKNISTNSIWLEQNYPALNDHSLYPLVPMTQTVGQDGWESIASFTTSQWYKKLSTLTAAGTKAIHGWAIDYELFNFPHTAKYDDKRAAFNSYQTAFLAAVAPRDPYFFISGYNEKFPTARIVQSLLDPPTVARLKGVIWMDLTTLYREKGPDAYRTKLHELREITGDKTIIQIGFFGGNKGNPDIAELSFAQRIENAKAMINIILNAKIARINLLVPMPMFDQPGWSDFVTWLKAKQIAVNQAS